MEPSKVKTFSDIHHSCEFPHSYSAARGNKNCHITPNKMTAWCSELITHYNGDKALFLQRLHDAINPELPKSIFDVIVEFCESIIDNGNHTKLNILSTLNATSEAHETREWAWCLLTEGGKWYSANSDSIETRSPMLLFEFAVPVHVYRYCLQSANDCPYRDPSHWYLFGVFGDELDGRNKVVVLREHKESPRRKRNNHERRKWISFAVPDVDGEQLRFKFIGIKIIKGHRNAFDIQLGGVLLQFML